MHENFFPQSVAKSEQSLPFQTTICKGIFCVSCIDSVFIFLCVYFAECDIQLFLTTSIVIVRFNQRYVFVYVAGVEVGLSNRQSVDDNCNIQISMLNP